jgi:hypothetical protein
MSQQHVLYIRKRQWPLQHRIVVKINLADRQVVGGSPVGIYLIKQLQGKSLCFHGSIILIKRTSSSFFNGNTTCLPVHRPSILDDYNVHAVWSHNPELTVTPP